jgi:hypothetical protein
MRNVRAQSYFLAYRAALEVRLGHLDRGEASARSARALAETGHFPDLVAYARLSMGKLLRARKLLREATIEYRAALEEARRLGIGRLESEVLAELSRLALGLGDVEIARQRAAESLLVANSLGLGLRQTHALLMLGLATARAGQRDLGVAFLKLTWNFATQQEYWLRRREAEEFLEQLGENPRE